MSLALAGASVALAQVEPPDAGSLQRDSDPSRRPTPPSAESLRPQYREPSKRPAAGARVTIASIHITGATRYPESELQELLSDVVGHEVSYLDLRRAVDRIAQHYRANGWFARAYLPEQSLQDGVLTIVVLEAKLGDVRVEEASGRSRVDADVVRKMLKTRQRNSDAVAIDALERSALLIDDLPGISAKVRLAPGDVTGETDVLATVSNTRTLRANLQADNSGVQSTGRGRITGELLYESPLGQGEELAALLNFSERTKFGRLSYDFPFGSDGFRLRPSASVFEYELGERFADLDAHGHAVTWGLTAIYPWVRSNLLNVQLTGGYEHRHYENFALDLQSSSPVVRAVQGGVSIDRIDSLGGGGIMQYFVQFTRGTLELRRNAADFAVDAITARSDGGYVKAEWNIARLQRLGSRDQLLLKVVGQSASKNLSSSEKISLGGAYGVRAFPELEATGDAGWIASTEWFHSFARDWRLSLFYDYGAITQHEDLWTDWNSNHPAVRNHYALAGVGASVNWTLPNGFALRGSVATRTAHNPARDPETREDGDGTAREPQLWVTTRWQF
jgi:hemolysin activation/secretion protein